MGGSKLSVRPYVMDLASTNGVKLNGERIDDMRYYELKEKVRVRGLGLRGSCMGAEDVGNYEAKDKLRVSGLWLGFWCFEAENSSFYELEERVNS